MPKRVPHVASLHTTARKKGVDTRKRMMGDLSYAEHVLMRVSTWLEKLQHDEALSSDLRTQASSYCTDVRQALHGIQEPTDG